MRVVGILLAAGASRRLGLPKQLLPDASGQAMVVRTAMVLHDVGCAPVVVVTGAAHDAVSRELEPCEVSLVFNASWSEGMGSSIRCAMEWLNTTDIGAGADAVIIAACDMPSVTRQHVQAMASAFRTDGMRVASSYDAPSGARVLGIPALFPRSDWSELRSLSGDRGARALLLKSDTSVVNLPGGGFDLDTPSDVERWRAEETQSGR
jgi:CTP:molybdopterin cytidylyltransferase MocA